MILLSKSLFIIFIFALLAFADSLNLSQGDFYYSLRAENASGNMAKETNIKEAVKYYKQALKDSSAREEAAWKLLRAYYFFGCFTIPSSSGRKVHFEQAKKEGKAFWDEFPQNTEVAYWYSVCLALWVKDLSSAVIVFSARNGASETRKVAKLLIESEKNNKVAAARGYQLMGGLHKKLPKFIPGVRKDSVEFYLKKSLDLNPSDLGSRLILAEYYNEDKKDMATVKAILEPALKNKPRPEEYLEDERNYIKMRNLLSSRKW